MTTSVPENKR